ncbi:uncharacterized protein LOC117719185 [Arvicanthis niloticus]|uniref:uncharacterized protein LOC117719185 n=1 Tax=Arvicanthis niloticus TaxID=61156 RepID=UPI00402B2AC5
MSSDAGPVSFALLLLPEWRSEARARRPSQRPQVRRGRRQPQPSPVPPPLPRPGSPASKEKGAHPGGGGGSGGSRPSHPTRRRRRCWWRWRCGPPSQRGMAPSSPLPTSPPTPPPSPAHRLPILSPPRPAARLLASPAAWRGLRWGSLARASLTPREDAGCNLDPGREGPGSRAPPGYLLFFICFLLPGRRRKAQRKGKGRTEAARAAAPVPSGCAGARREARYFSLQIGSLRGLAATRKCILALRAAEGAGQSRHSPAQPRASLETLGTRRGPAAGRVTSPSFLQDPPLPRGARHVGKRELWRASARSPGWPRLDKAPTTPAQPTCTLLGPEAPTSSWAPSRPRVPSQAREVRRGPATGGTCDPRSQIRETVPGR